jgi:hypothetical protein
MRRLIAITIIIALATISACKPRSENILTKDISSSDSITLTDNQKKIVDSINNDLDSINLGDGRQFKIGPTTEARSISDD